MLLTFDQPLSHKVVIHGFSNDLGDLFTVKFHKAITFTSASLQIKQTTKAIKHDHKLNYTAKKNCGYMGFFVQLCKVVKKLNEPFWYWQSYLTLSERCTKGNFQTVPLS